MAIKRFEADRKQQEIEIVLKGEVQKFLLVEMNGAEKDTHSLFVSQFYDPEKRKVVKTDGQHADLIARCIRDEKGELLHPKIEDTRRWVQLEFSSSVQIALYEECEKICNLVPDPEKEKNE